MKDQGRDLPWFLSKARKLADKPESERVIECSPEEFQRVKIQAMFYVPSYLDHITPASLLKVVYD